jgi:5-methylthioadenosine/S-adenosylhomocysteine deaminase
LGELKVAWLYSQRALAGLFSARDVVGMATRDAARILKWDRVVGTIEAGRRADLFVVDSTVADPYDALIRAKETDIRLVMINGIARYGVPDVMRRLAAADQTIHVGGRTRSLFLQQESGDPNVAQVPLDEATSRLREALQDVVKLAKETEKPKVVRGTRGPVDVRTEPVWSLALDEISECGVELSPRLPFEGPGDFTGPVRAPQGLSRGAAPLSTILQPVALDPLTVVDDTFLDKISKQPNLPAWLRRDLSTLY